MENSLKEQVDLAREEMLDCWELAKTVGSIECFSLLINCSQKYYSLLKEYEDELNSPELY